MISEKGNLQETLFGKLVVTLYEKKVTGILYLRVGGVLKEIYINQGKIIWSVSTADDEKLDSILVTSMRMDPGEVENLKKEHHLSSTVSFFMQEKGIVTHDQVVAAFRQQVSRIFAHILKQHEGEYNFVYGLSPKKAIDMEMEIPECLRQAIREKFKREDILKFFISNQTELKRSEATLSEENEEVLSMMTPREQAILGQLEEWTSLEALIDHFAGQDSDEFLRDVFMMAICGWIDKNELPDDQQAMSAQQQPVLHNESFPAGSPKENESPEQLDFSSPRRDEPPEIENIDLEPPKKEERFDFSLAPEEEPAPAPKPYKDKKEKKELSRNFPVKIPPTAKPRTSPVKLITTIAIIVIAAASLAYLYLSGMLFPKKADTPEPAPIARPRLLRRGVTAVKNEDSSQAQKAEVKNSEPQTALQPQNKKPTADATTQDKQVIAGGETAARPPVTKPPPTTPDEKAKPEVPATKLLESGQLSEAADLWMAELLKSGSRYGILLELDCAKESVAYAYEQFGDKSDFYILKRNKNGRNCFLVLWGKFKSPEEAQAAQKKLPAFFWKQPEPPAVIELQPYLAGH